MFIQIPGVPFSIRLGPGLLTRLFMVPVLTLGLMLFFFFHGFGLDLYPEEPGPLDLPAELVVGQAPPLMDWYPDPVRGGLIVVSNATGDPWNPVPRVERMDPPWQECKPAEQAAEAPLGAASQDGRFLARIGRGKNYQASLSMLEVASDKVVAALDPFPATLNGKFVVWHPTANFLVAVGGDQITLLGEPAWRPKTLKTASRDLDEWKRLNQLGQEETGYHPNEMASHLLFSADGALMVCAMDRGLRVYSWEKVLKAEGQLPPPEYAAEGEVVALGRFASLRMTYTAAFDDARRWVLWAGIAGTLDYLDTTTQARGTLLRLPKGYQITRMQFLDSGKLLACEIHKFGHQSSESQGLFLLDYARLVERGEAAP